MSRNTLLATEIQDKGWKKKEKGTAYFFLWERKRLLFQQSITCGALCVTGGSIPDREKGKFQQWITCTPRVSDWNYLDKCISGWVPNRGNDAWSALAIETFPDTSGTPLR
jgi:hypothetical protein